ncbi:MAG TPA: GNAT family N-acetyltransferase [Thermoanaerobaculia bacterium]|nr:GNAT family N-acetyltransferase [Thermoanaerobaculia bacterium]
MIVRRATASDAAALAELGARTFIDTFAAQNRPEDIEAYVAKSYGVAQQLREIGDTLVVEENGALVAFAQLHRSASPFGDIELGRFYVDRTHHGRGIAQALMDAVLAAARTLGGRKLWLGVWEHNPRAISFYAKCGFADEGSQPFTVGSDVQTDRIMTLTL